MSRVLRMLVFTAASCAVLALTAAPHLCPTPAADNRQRSKSNRCTSCTADTQRRDRTQRAQGRRAKTHSMDRLVRLRQREARRGGEQRAATTLSSLPAELLGNVVEYACPYKVLDLGHGIFSHRGSWLGDMLLVGCTNSTFLEALKYVGRLEIDIMHRRWPDALGAHEGMLPRAMRNGRETGV